MDIEEKEKSEITNKHSLPLYLSNKSQQKTI